MLTINVIDDRINGTINGEKFNVAHSSTMYETLVTFQQGLESIDNVEAYDTWVKEVQKALASDKGGDIVTTACSDLVCDDKTGNYYVKVGAKVSKHAVPDALVNVILESAEKNIDPTPIVKAWIRFLRNPNFTSQKAFYFAEYVTAVILDDEECERLVVEEGYTDEKAYEKASYNDVAITTEGLIVTKKYARLLTEGWKIDQKTNEPVRKPLFTTTKTVDQFSGDVIEITDFPEFVEDLTFEPPVQGRSGNAFFCGDVKDHIIKVGEKHELERWDQVNTDDNSCCVPGLHVGGWQYVQSYKSLNAQLLECFVDPAEIGAICGMDRRFDSDGAMRVKSYFIYGAVNGRTRSIYHSSKYAAKQDEAWEAYKKEAVESAEKVNAEEVDFDVN